MMIREFFSKDRNFVPESVITLQLVLAYLRLRGLEVSLIGCIGRHHVWGHSATGVYYKDNSEIAPQLMAVVPNWKQIDIISGWSCIQLGGSHKYFPNLDLQLNTFRWLYEAKARQAFREIRSGRRVAPVIVEPLFVPEKQYTIHVKHHDSID